MKNLSKKSRIYQQEVKARSAEVSNRVSTVSAAIRNRVYTKTASRRPASFRNPSQRVKPC